MENLQKVENNATQVDQMVNSIIGNTTVELDNYVAKVRTCFLDAQEMLDDDLDKIVLQMPVYLYPIILLSQQIEMRKGVATEQAKYAKNEAQLCASGTVNDKTAQAENATAQERIVELAYKTAAAVIQKKIDGALAILDSTKKVQQRRMKEKALTVQAGSAVGAF